MKITDLFEKRRNATHPSQPTRSVVETFLKYKDRPDVFISFTDLPKIGMNPMTNYNTPAGIYCYPVSEFAKKIKPEMTYNQFVDAFPFASNRPFLFFIRATKPITFIQDYTEDDLNRDRQKFMQITGQDEAKTNYHERQSRYKSPFGRLWGIMFSYIGRMEKSTIRWNSLLRKMGFHSIVDYGDGIIHPNEKTQAFFLSSSDYEVVEMFKVNKAAFSSLYFSKMRTISDYDKKKVKQIRQLLQDPNKADEVRRQFLYAGFQVQLELLSDIMKFARSTKDFDIIASLDTSVLKSLPSDFIDFIASEIHNMDITDKTRLFKFLPIDTRVKMLLNDVVDISLMRYMQPHDLKHVSHQIKEQLFTKIFNYIDRLMGFGNIDHNIVKIIPHLRDDFPPELSNVKFRKYWTLLLVEGYLDKIETIPEDIILHIFDTVLIGGYESYEEIFKKLPSDLKVQVFKNQLEFMITKSFHKVYEPEQIVDSLPWKSLGTAFEECISIFEDTIYGLVDIGQLNSTKPFDEHLDIIRELYGKT